MSYRNRLFYSILLNLSVSTCILLSATYVNMLFLAYYPPSWLSYHYAGQALFIIILVLTFNAFSKQWPKQASIVVFLLAPIIILTYLASPTRNFWFPFIVCTLLAPMRSLWGTIMWTNINNSFDMREFKKASIAINVAGVIGITMLMGITPFLIHTFGSSYIPYEITVLAIVSIFLIYRQSSMSIELQTTERVQHKKTQPRATRIEISLFILVAIICVLSVTLRNLLDFSLKFALSENYSVAQIGSYTAIILVIGNLLTVFLSFFTSKQLITYFGVPISFVLTPLFTGLMVIALIFYPSLMVVALVFIINSGFTFAFDSLAPKLTFNALPSYWTASARILLLIIAIPLGLIISAAILLVSPHLGLRIMGAIVFCCALAGLILSLFIFKYYSQALQKSLHLQHFRDETVTDASVHDAWIWNIANTAIKSKEQPVQKYGVNLLTETNIPKLPTALKNLVTSPDSEIRYKVSVLLSQHRYKKFLSAVISAFEHESDAEILWNWASILAPHKKYSKIFANTHASSEAVKQAIGIMFLYETQQFDVAKAYLTKLMEKSDPESIYWCARLFAKGYQLDIAEDYLINKLLSEKNTKVCRACLQAATKVPTSKVIAVLCSMLNRTDLTRSILETLKAIGSTTLPCLAESLQNPALYEQRFVIIKTICAINSEQSKELIADVLATKHPLFCYYAAHCVTYYYLTQTSLAKYRTAREQWTPIAHEQIHECLIELKHLRQLRDSFNDDFIKTEIDLRIYIVTYQFLCWTALLVGGRKILHTISLFHADNLRNLDKVDKAKLIELLDVQIKDRKLATTLDEVFEGERKRLALTHQADIKNDPWLDQLIETYAEGSMQKFYYIAKLRNVPLFKNLPAETLQSLAEIIEVRQVVQNQKIITQGEEGDGMYIIGTGSVSVIKDGEVVNELHEGDYFGELALIDNLPRTASVVAKEDGVMFFVDRPIFLHLCDSFPEILRELVRNFVGYIRKKDLDVDFQFKGD